MTTEDQGETLDLERCTRPSVQIAVRNAKFLSSQKRADQYTAVIVIKNIESSEQFHFDQLS